MITSRWMVAAGFALALAVPVRAADSLDEIRADLANCKGPPACLTRTLLQARLNYRLKMMQMAQIAMGSIAASVPGAGADLRGAVASITGALAGNAGGTGGGGSAPNRAAPGSANPTPAVTGAARPSPANPSPANPTPANPTPPARTPYRAPPASPGTAMLQVALSEPISADALKNDHPFRALSLVPVMAGGKVMVPPRVTVYLKVRTLGPGPQPNSVRLSIAADSADVNGTRVPLTSNEIERVIQTVSGGPPRPGALPSLIVNTRLAFAVSLAAR